MKASEAHQIAEHIQAQATLEEYLAAIYKTIKQYAQQGNKGVLLADAVGRLPNPHPPMTAKIVSALKNEGYITTFYPTDIDISWDLTNDTGETSAPNN